MLHKKWNLLKSSNCDSSIVLPAHDSFQPDWVMPTWLGQAQAHSNWFDQVLLTMS